MEKKIDKKIVVFLDKKCKLVQIDNFVLSGIVTDIDNYGIMFQTKQKTSFIAWANIREITPLEG